MICEDKDFKAAGLKALNAKTVTFERRGPSFFITDPETKNQIVELKTPTLGGLISAIVNVPLPQHEKTTEKIETPEFSGTLTTEVTRSPGMTRPATVNISRNGSTPQNLLVKNAEGPVTGQDQAKKILSTFLDNTAGCQ